HTRFSRDWSSDVCSSDLDSAIDHHGCALAVARFETTLDPVVPGTAELADVSAVDAGQCGVVLVAEVSTDLGEVLVAGGVVPGQQIGRASCREREDIWWGA